MNFAERLIKKHIHVYTRETHAYINDLNMLCCFHIVELWYRLCAVDGWHHQQRRPSLLRVSIVNLCVCVRTVWQCCWPFQLYMYFKLSICTRIGQTEMFEISNYKGKSDKVLCLSRRNESFSVKIFYLIFLYLNLFTKSDVNHKNRNNYLHFISY